MSKKILSMALAVIMLISVFAFSASAANTTVTTTFPEAGYCGYRVVTDAYVGMPAGEQVTVKVYWVLPYGADRPVKMSSGNCVIAYNSAAYTYNTDNDGDTSAAYDGRTWGAAYKNIFGATAGVNTGPTYTNNIMGKLTDAEKAYGWTKVAGVAYTFSTNSGTTPQEGLDCDYDCEIFSLSFTTQRTITANDVFGIPNSTLGGMTKASYSNGTKQIHYAKKLVNSEPAVPATSSVNETSGAKFRMSSEAGKVDLGITGTVKTVSLDPGKTAVLGGDGTTRGYTASNIVAVGAQARVNGVVSAGEDNYVYETADGFKFRAAITGIDATGLAADIDVRTYITDKNGNTYFSNWMNIDAVTAHNASVAGSNGNFAGIL